MHMHVSIRVSACDARPPDRPQRRFLILAGVVFAPTYTPRLGARARRRGQKILGRETLFPRWRPVGGVTAWFAPPLFLLPVHERPRQTRA